LGLARAGRGEAARWLRYLPRERIIDERNAPRVVGLFARIEARPFTTAGIDVEIPIADAIMPRVGVGRFDGIQPYRLAVIGKKSSLEDVVGPLCEQWQADPRRT
jgi:hypothetical protein